MELTYKLEDHGSFDRISLSGNINEDAEVVLEQMQSSVTKDTVFNFGGVKMVNSCGVRAWINFLREVSGNKKLVFEECTPEIVGQINMIPNFRGEAEVRSVYADFACENCDHSEWKLFKEGENLPTNPEDFEAEKYKCPSCGDTLEMEELEEEFFAFLAS